MRIKVGVDSGLSADGGDHFCQRHVFKADLNFRIKTRVNFAFDRGHSSSLIFTELLQTTGRHICPFALFGEAIWVSVVEGDGRLVNRDKRIDDAVFLDPLHCLLCNDSRSKLLFPHHRDDDRICRIEVLRLLSKRCGFLKTLFVHRLIEIFCQRGKSILNFQTDLTFSCDVSTNAFISGVRFNLEAIGSNELLQFADAAINSR